MGTVNTYRAESGGALRHIATGDLLTTGETGTVVSSYKILASDALTRSNVVIPPDGETYYQSITNVDDKTYDARTTTLNSGALTEAASYVSKLGNTTGKARTAVVGGYFATKVPITWDWHEVKSAGGTNWDGSVNTSEGRDGAGILFGGFDWMGIDGARFYNVQDAFRPRQNGGTLNAWFMKNCWGDWIRDDVIEDDGTGAPGGLIWDTLIEGTFMFLSCGQNQTWNGQEPVTIERSLIHLKPMPYTQDVGGSQPYLNTEYGNDVDRHGHLFKQHANGDFPIHAKNTVFFIEQHSVDGSNQSNEDILTVASSTAENVILIWLGYTPSAYPGAYPSGVTEYNRLTTNSGQFASRGIASTGAAFTEAELRAVWESYADEWKIRHGFEAGEAVNDRPTFFPAKMIAPDPF
jgi:hypothetical protein